MRLSEVTEKMPLIFLFARRFGFMQTSSTSYYTKIIGLSQRTFHYLIWRKNLRLSQATEKKLLIFLFARFFTF